MPSDGIEDLQRYAEEGDRWAFREYTPDRENRKAELKGRRGQRLGAVPAVRELQAFFQRISDNLSS